ncbi:MAG: DUF1697 domain-containing protein [Acidimicrobiia bacterium]
MRYAIFLRAINVGGRRIKMADLRTAFQNAGYEDVATHLASGNVIVTSATRPAEAAVSGVIADRFGFESEAFVRSRSEVRSILDRVPWDPASATIEVSFLDTMPGHVAARDLEATATPPEALVVSEHEVFFRRVGGGVETTHKEETTVRMLGAVTTRRGLRTVQGIYDRYLQQ